MGAGSPTRRQQKQGNGNLFTRGIRSEDNSVGNPKYNFMQNELLVKNMHQFAGWPFLFIFLFTAPLINSFFCTLSPIFFHLLLYLLLFCSFSFLLRFLLLPPFYFFICLFIFSSYAPLINSFFFLPLILVFHILLCLSLFCQYSLFFFHLFYRLLFSKYFHLLLLIFTPSSPLLPPSLF